MANRSLIRIYPDYNMSTKVEEAERMEQSELGLPVCRLVNPSLSESAGAPEIEGYYFTHC
ncbi:hypothetical protein ACKVWC_008436 [Pyricularia oryzae]